MLFARASRTIGRFLLPAAALLMLGGVTVSTVGCGGGGGGGGGGGESQQATLGTTRTALIRVVQQSRALPTLLGVVGAGIGDIPTRSAGSRKTLAQAAVQLWRRDEGPVTRQTGGLTFYPELNLYARTTEGATSYRVDFFEDAGGAEEAGSIVASATSLSTAQVEFDVTGGDLPLDGTLNLAATGTNVVRTTGTVRLPSRDETVSPDIVTNTSDGSTTGSLTTTSEIGTLRYTNLQAQAVGSFTSDVGYRTATGNVNQSADGSGRAQLGLNATQRYEAGYNADGSGALVLYNNNGGLEQEIAVVDNFDEL